MLFAVKNLRASRVNLLMNDYAAGLPSPLAFLGLGDAVARQLGLDPWSASALPILHRVEENCGRTKPEMEPKKPRRQKGASFQFMPIESMEDLTGHVEVSLLLDLPGWNSDIGVANAIEGHRLAGGTIQNDQIQVAAANPDGAAFQSFRLGYAMFRPETQKYQVISTGDRQSLARIASLLFPVEPRKGSGWWVPVAVGHHLLEDPGTVPKRIGTRNPDVPHVFSEPVLGIAELASVRNKKLKNLTESELKALLWSWDARGEYVLAHPNYHP